MEDIENEITETEQLLGTSTFSGVKSVLQVHLNKLKKSVELKKLQDEQKAVASSSSNSLPPPPTKIYAAPGPEFTFIPIETYSWDQGEYNSATVSIFVDLDGVGSLKKDAINVKFSKVSFDLTVIGLNGKNYRLLKDNLEKDIVPDQSTYVIKKNKVVIKLRKVKGEYSYEHWTQLTSKKKRDESNGDAKADPMGGIMDMMKNMYEEGDDNMKRVIGEAMMKSQRGEKPAPPSMMDNDF